MHLAGSTLLTAFDGRMNLTSVFDVAGNPVERYRYDPFGEPAVFSGAGAPLPGTAVGAGPVFGGMYYVASARLYLSRRRLMDPARGVFLSIDPFAYADSPSLYAYAGQDPIILIDPSGEFAFLAILAVMAIGALVAGGLNAARQGIQIAEGSRSEFSWGELGLSMGIGAVAAPILVAAPELAVPLAAYGVAGGLDQMSQGHYATGTFDIVTSLAPFGLKGTRAATLGEGTRFGQMRGLGESASWSTRFGRFNQLDSAIRTTAGDAWNRRFYRGTTYYEALTTEQNNMIDLDVVLGRQRNAAAPPRLGPGLYFTETMEPPVQGSAGYWADLHGGSGTGGGPAVLEARIPRLSWWQLGRQEGVVSRVPQPNFPLAPSTLETFVPEGLAPWFNEQASWRVLPDAPVPGPNFSSLWPTLFTPPFRTPDLPFASPGDGGAAESSAGSNGKGAGSTSGPGSSGKK
jgi:RHS repeat-associated protein